MIRTLRAPRAVLVGASAALALAAVPAGASAARGPATAVPDSYSTPDLGTLVVNPDAGVLANDERTPAQIIRHTDPSHGSLTLQPDGSFEYVPELGYTGTDTFTYTVSNDVALYSTHLPPLGAFGGVTVTAGAYGSSLSPVPGHPGKFAGLTDRGPNVSAPDGNDVLPIPSFDPSIGIFKMSADGDAVLLRRIPLQDASGHPYSGLVNSGNPTGETMENLAGQKLADDPDGYDSEGLVMRPNGTFWVSDEYGPYITHFSSDGRAISRLSPLDGSLPAELANRVPNKGMEGLTITPDGTTLVGMMQSALQQSDLNGAKPTNLAPTRIVTYNLKTHAVHEYLYLLHDPATTGTAVSEITALSDTKFLVDERDGKFPGPGVYKRLWKINITHATDVGPDAQVSGADYDGSSGGLLVGGKTIEALTLGENTAKAGATLAAAGITPVKESQFLDINALLLSLDPSGAFFDHDKIEGVATLDGGRDLWISNDSDFGLAGVTNDAPPWTLEAKIDPATGLQDDGEYLEIHTSRLDHGTSAGTTSTATVTIDVGSGSGSGS